MVAQYVVAAPKVENINFGWFSSGKLVAPKEDNIHLSPDAGGGLDDAGSPVYFKKITVTPDDERAWFRMHPQWSKSNKYAELEAWIYI